jgi:glutamine synthetase
MISDTASARQFLADDPGVDVLEVLLVDLNGVLRGKWIPRDKFDSALDGKLKMPLTAVTPDIWGRDVPELCGHTGDGDGIIVPSLRTLRNVQRRFEAKGLRAVVAPELEFMLLASGRDAEGAPIIPGSRINGPKPVGGQLYSTDLMHEYADVLHEMRESCDALDLGVETLVKELAPAQYEINQAHLDDPLRAADNAQMMKRVIKDVAAKHGYVATFMPKPFTHIDGNGFHAHISVIDVNGQNIFDDGGDDGTPALRHAVAGLAATMPDLMLVFAPHRNSYRRYAVGTHIPQAPTWGYENRDVALRIPCGDPKGRRIEHRVPGADANPYLVLAALLAGVLHGLDSELEAPPPVEGSDGQERTLAGDWLTATRDFEASPLVAEYLGQPFKDAFLAIKRSEQAEFDRRVNAFEYDTYLVTS